MSEFAMNDELAAAEAVEATTESETPKSESPEPEAEGETRSARLIVKRSGVETDEVFEIHPPSVVGRFDVSVGPIDVDLGTIPEGTYVSRKHAEITCEDGVWRIQDLGSSNGTFILRNDFERIETAELNDGDELALGNARFVFRLA